MLVPEPRRNDEHIALRPVQTLVLDDRAAASSEKACIPAGGCARRSSPKSRGGYALNQVLSSEISPTLAMSIDDLLPPRSRLSSDRQDRAASQRPRSGQRAPTACFASYFRHSSANVASISSRSAAGKSSTMTILPPSRVLIIGPALCPKPPPCNGGWSAMSWASSGLSTLHWCHHQVGGTMIDPGPQ